MIIQYTIDGEFVNKFSSYEEVFDALNINIQEYCNKNVVVNNCKFISNII